MLTKIIIVIITIYRLSRCEIQLLKVFLSQFGGFTSYRLSIVGLDNIYFLEKGNRISD